MAPPRKSGEPPTWAVAVIVGTVAFVGLTFTLLQGSHNSWRAALPFGDSDFFWVGLIFLPMAVLIIVAVVAKLIDARRAKRWIAAQGRIVKSTVEARRHQFAGDTTTVANVPVIEYEFTAKGKTWRGDRISIGDDTGGANTEATLKRYPPGANVTVYFDPAKPSNCVLERDIPAEVGKGCLVLVVVGAAVVAGIYFAVTGGKHFLEEKLPNADVPVTLFAAGFGLAALLFFFVFRANAKEAEHWPSVRGKVLSSGTERIEKREDGRTRVYYAPAVEYTYRVHGIEYHSRTIALGVQTSGSQRWAEKTAAKYPEGREIEVHYNPENATNAALENPTGMTWLILAVAVACFALALHTAGIF